MARDKITVQLPMREATESLEIATITKQSITAANGIEIADALSDKNNSLFIILEPSNTGVVTVKAGDKYPNSMLGDLNVTPTASKVTAIQILDAARFERTDGSIYIDFASGFTGYIYAVAKRAGILPTSAQ